MSDQNMNFENIKKECEEAATAARSSFRMV